MSQEITYQHYKILAVALHPPTKEMVAALRDTAIFREEISREPLESLREEYYRLFSLSVSGGITPYETEYLCKDTFQKGHALADAAGFYLAFGLDVFNAHERRPDFISTELEFLFWLGLKRSWALSRSKADEADQCESAMKKFLYEHVAGWGIAFGKQVAQESSSPFYRKVGLELAGFLEAECRRVGLESEAVPFFRKAGLEEARNDSCGDCGAAQ